MDVSLARVARAVVLFLLLSGLASLLVRIQEVMLFLLPHGGSVLLAYLLIVLASGLPIYLVLRAIGAQAAVADAALSASNLA